METGAGMVVESGAEAGAEMGGETDPHTCTCTRAGTSSSLRHTLFVSRPGDGDRCADVHRDRCRDSCKDGYRNGHRDGYRDWYREGYGDGYGDRQQHRVVSCPGGLIEPW